MTVSLSNLQRICWGAGVLGCWGAGVLGCWGAGVLGCWGAGVHRPTVFKTLVLAFYIVYGIRRLFILKGNL